MFAVVSSGGKQYRVEPGSTVVVDRVASEPGATITFDRVLLIGDGDATTVGTPTVSGASVTGTVLGEELGPKLVIFKFKQKVKYRRRTGHRQHLSLVRIDEINADGQSKRKSGAKPAAAEAEAPDAAAEASAPAPVEESKPKARTTRTRAAKPKPAEAEASTAAEETGEKPKRRAPARAKKAETAEE